MPEKEGNMLQTLSFQWLQLNKHFQCSQCWLDGYWIAATPSKRCGMSNTFRKTKNISEMCTLWYHTKKYISDCYQLFAGGLQIRSKQSFSLILKSKEGVDSLLAETKMYKVQVPTVCTGESCGPRLPAMVHKRHTVMVFTCTLFLQACVLLVMSVPAWVTHTLM